MNSSVRPTWPSLKMIAASYPAAAALAALTSKVQVPRWINATAGPVGAAGKSAASQPESVVPASPAGGNSTSIGTTVPVTSPLAE